MAESNCCGGGCRGKTAQQVVAERAYYKWLADGAPQGSDGVRYWLEAERELTRSEVELEEVLEVELVEE